MKDANDFARRQLEALNVAWTPRAHDRRRVWQALERRLSTERRVPSPGPVVPAPRAAQSPLAEPNAAAQGASVHGASVGPAAAKAGPIATGLAKLGSGKVIAVALVSGGAAAGGAGYVAGPDTANVQVVASTASRPSLPSPTGDPVEDSAPAASAPAAPAIEPTISNLPERSSKSTPAIVPSRHGGAPTADEPPGPRRREPRPSLSPALAVLRHAQHALHQGEPERALLLTTGVQEDTEDPLEEERLALRAAAFCLAGEVGAGRQTVASLLERYPGSIYAARTNAACAGDEGIGGADRKMKKSASGHSPGKEDDDE